MKNCKSCKELINDGIETSPGGVMLISWYKCRRTENRMSRVSSNGYTIDGTDRPCECKQELGKPRG